jgi:hypothetical protein
MNVPINWRTSRGLTTAVASGHEVIVVANAPSGSATAIPWLGIRCDTSAK